MISTTWATHLILRNTITDDGAHHLTTKETMIYPILILREKLPGPTYQCYATQRTSGKKACLDTEYETEGRVGFA